MTTGGSRLGTRLADRLIGVADDIRRRVHGALGTRQYRVYVVTRTWSGVVRGVGTPTVTTMEIDPPPQVEFEGDDNLGPSGRESGKKITITRVSLRYSEGDLQPRVDERAEVSYRIVDVRGQGQSDVWATLCANPIPRRGDKLDDETDWKLVLNQTSAMGDHDGVDSP